MNLSFELDDFIRNKDETFYYLTLEDGRTIFQDDERYGKEDRTWHRVRKFLQETKLKVVRIGLRFRSNHVVVMEPEDYDGLFYDKRIHGDLAGPQYSGKTLQKHGMRFGVIKNGKAYCKEYRVPGLIFECDSVVESPKEVFCIYTKKEQSNV